MYNYSKQTKDKALAMRKRGFTYSQISKAMKIPAVTVGYWVRKAPLVDHKASVVTKKAALPVVRGLDSPLQTLFNELGESLASLGALFKSHAKR